MQERGTCGQAKSQGGFRVGHFARPIVLPDRAGRGFVHGGCGSGGRDQAGS
jgi:hypothetical protein